MEVKEYENPKIIGIDREEADPEIGIMSPSYCLTFEDEGVQHQFWFDWDVFYDLVKEFKPFCKEIEDE